MPALDLLETRRRDRKISASVGQYSTDRASAQGIINRLTDTGPLVEIPQRLQEQPPLLGAGQACGLSTRPLPSRRAVARRELDFDGALETLPLGLLQGRLTPCPVSLRAPAFGAASAAAQSPTLELEIAPLASERLSLRSFAMTTLQQPWHCLLLPLTLTLRHSV